MKPIYIYFEGPLVDIKGMRDNLCQNVPQGEKRKDKNYPLVIKKGKISQKFFLFLSAYKDEKNTSSFRIKNILENFSFGT